MERQIVLGKHSGSNAIIMKFKEYGINLSNEEANNILPILRSTTINLKRPPFDKEIMYIYERIFKGEGRQGIQGIRRLIQFNGSDNQRRRFYRWVEILYHWSWG